MLTKDNKEKENHDVISGATQLSVWVKHGPYSLLFLLLDAQSDTNKSKSQVKMACNVIALNARNADSLIA